MKINAAGLDIIKRFEGFRLKAYRCPANVLTIGYGHTRDPFTGKLDVAEDRVLKSEHEAAEILKLDLEKFERDVEQATGTCALNENQFSALVSFAFNVGTQALLGSTLLKKLLKGDALGAADEFPKWNKARGQVLKGLSRRRAEERDLFLQVFP